MIPTYTAATDWAADAYYGHPFRTYPKVSRTTFHKTLWDFRVISNEIECGITKWTGTDRHTCLFISGTRDYRGIDRWQEPTGTWCRNERGELNYTTQNHTKAEQYQQQLHFDRHTGEWCFPDLVYSGIAKKPENPNDPRNVALAGETRPVMFFVQLKRRTLFLGWYYLLQPYDEVDSWYFCFRKCQYSLGWLGHE